MSAPFRLDQHPRRASGPPLSAPPVGYFDRLPMRVMARVAAPPVAARPALLPTWLLRAPAALRTSLASTLLLGTFAASLWLGGGLAGSGTGADLSSPLARLDAVPRAELVEYLLAPETTVENADLAEYTHQHHLGLTRQYLRPSSRELTEALDAQPAEEPAL